MRNSLFFTPVLSPDVLSTDKCFADRSYQTFLQAGNASQDQFSTCGVQWYGLATAMCSPAEQLAFFLIRRWVWL